MPELIRRPEAHENEPAAVIGPETPTRTRREKRLYVALAVISSLNILAISGAVTFWALLIYR